MSDNSTDTGHDYLRTTSSSRLFADVAILMMKGAAYAAIFCFSLWILYAILVGFAGLLPPESKEAPDPTPFSALSVSPIRVI